jgi:crossover junction endodeoxyribonuclease RuvC
MEQVFIGIDQSLTKTGIVILKNKSMEMLYSGLIESEPKKGIEPIYRMLEIKESLRKIIQQYKPVQGIIEGFGFSSRGRSIFDLGGLGYIIRELFVEENIFLLVIAPATLKKYVTNKGNCKKDLMLLNVYKRWGVEFNDNNLADAYGLARIGIDLHYVKMTGDEKFLKRNNIEKKLLEDHYHQIIGD